MRLINSDLLIFEDCISTTVDKIKIYNSLLNAHQNNKLQLKKYRKDFFNFKIEDCDPFFNFLYEIFLEKCKELFGELELSSNNKNYCWAYVSNHYERGGYNAIHNHELTSTINSVYYLNVPDKSSGQISFFDGNNNEIYKYQPKENSFLIFPFWLKHCANISYSLDYRISINMEIITKQNVWDIFKK